MEQQISIEKLSSEDRKALMAELVADQKKEKQRKLEDRKTYRTMVDETIPELFNHLAHASEVLTKAKQKVFEETKDLVDLKNSIYGVKLDQQSHTFSTSAGDFTITRGFRVVEGWDDTYIYGVEKIKECLALLASTGDSKSVKLAKITQRLLRPDKKGMLKASRVIELSNVATEIDMPLFYEGIEILQTSFRPVKSVTFIEASWRDENGHTHSVPLSISAIDIEK